MLIYVLLLLFAPQFTYSSIGICGYKDGLCRQPLLSTHLTAHCVPLFKKKSNICERIPHQFQPILDGYYTSDYDKSARLAEIQIYGKEDAKCEHTMKYNWTISRDKCVPFTTHPAVPIYAVSLPCCQWWNPFCPDYRKYSWPEIVNACIRGKYIVCSETNVTTTYYSDTLCQHPAGRVDVVKNDVCVDGIRKHCDDSYPISHSVSIYWEYNNKRKRGRTL
jgi:hypothetical protein